jgi:hypothetical protein
MTLTSDYTKESSVFHAVYAWERSPAGYVAPRQLILANNKPDRITFRGRRAFLQVRNKPFD